MVFLFYNFISVVNIYEKYNLYASIQGYILYYYDIYIIQLSITFHVNFEEKKYIMSIIKV